MQRGRSGRPEPSPRPPQSAIPIPPQELFGRSRPRGRLGSLATRLAWPEQAEAAAYFSLPS